MLYGDAMRLPIQSLYKVRRWLLARLGLRTRGVKVMVFNAAGELLLVRNSYGTTHHHLLPGGGIRPWFETPASAAAREVREEVGIAVERLTFVATFHSRAEGKRDVVHLFTAFTEDRPTAASFEIEEARFFPLDSLPETIPPATRRRVEEYRGERAAEGVW